MLESEEWARAGTTPPELMAPGKKEMEAGSVAARLEISELRRSKNLARAARGTCNWGQASVQCPGMALEWPYLMAPLDLVDFRAAKHMAVVGLEACSLARSRSSIGVTRVGELDERLWAQVWSKVFPSRQGEEKSAALKRDKMASIWEDFLAEKQSWSGVVATLREQPYGDTGAVGEAIYEAVMASMKEVESSYGNAESFVKLKAWNWDEGREATLAEVIRQLVAVLKENLEDVTAVLDELEKQIPDVAQPRARTHKTRAEEKKPAEKKPEESSSWIQWHDAFPFSEKEAIEFRRQRAVLKSKCRNGPGAEMQEARVEAFKVLLLRGSLSTIGVRELGYLGWQTLDEVADDWEDILMMRYQQVEFSYRMDFPRGASKFLLPEGYSDELKSMAGIRFYPSAACADRERREWETRLRDAKHPVCSCEIRSVDVVLGKENRLTSNVQYCRQCLAPQAWNYKRNRKATVSETMAFLIGIIICGQGRQQRLAKLAALMTKKCSCSTSNRCKLDPDLRWLLNC